MTTQIEKFFELFKRDIKTARLELRILEPTLENAELVWNALKNEKLDDFKYAPMVDGGLPKSLDETFAMMQRQDKWCKSNGVNFYVFHDGKLVGYQRIFYWESNKTLQFADVWFVKSVWGNGFSKEIHEVLEKIAFEELKVHRTTRQCMAGNIRSKNSIINAGYHLDGIMRDTNLLPDGTWMDHLCFTKLESEYKKL